METLLSPVVPYQIQSFLFSHHHIPHVTKAFDTTGHALSWIWSLALGIHSHPMMSSYSAELEIKLCFQSPYGGQDSLGPWFSNFSNASESPGGLIKKQIVRPTPRAPSLAWGLRICFPTKFPGDVHAAGLGNYALRARLCVLELHQRDVFP